ncbi:MAG TPA: hypothetical protein VM755_16715 [Stellaceae bacterium]|nr:hypothetical protein [Stellaceae bacterium]
MAAAAATIFVGATGAQAAGPQVPDNCKVAWAPYAAAGGDPVQPGGPYVEKGAQESSQVITVTITKVAAGKVWGQSHFTGATYNNITNFEGRLVNSDTFTFAISTGSRLRLKQFDDGLAGYIDSVVWNTCSPVVLRRVVSPHAQK